MLENLWSGTYKRDQEAFDKAKEEINELKVQEKKGELDLFYFDESGFSLDSQVPYAYQPIGKTIEIPSSRSKRINVLGFLSTDNKFSPYCFECSVNTDVVVACFNDFAKTITKKTRKKRTRKPKKPFEFEKPSPYNQQKRHTRNLLGYEFQGNSSHQNL